jgi:hypothetical protein
LQLLTAFKTMFLDGYKKHELAVIVLRDKLSKYCHFTH